jgi:hypothetical protein
MLDLDLNIEFDAPTSYAFDRSARRFDVDGRLHVADCRISPARANEYVGSEIPGHESLKLEPTRLHKMYRTPAALKDAASTFENMPLLLAHVAVSAADPQKNARRGHRVERALACAVPCGRSCRVGQGCN